MTESVTKSGIKFYISDTAQNDNLTQVEFDALTWTEVTRVGTIGEYGRDITINAYQLINGEQLKAKGKADYGSPAVECARSLSDAGQTAMRAAGDETVQDNYAFKVLYSTGEIDYLRGTVAGPVTNSGGNDDFVLHTFTLGLNQAPIEVPVSGS